jgi:outer membrane protein assembly factor BamA
MPVRLLPTLFLLSGFVCAQTSVPAQPGPPGFIQAQQIVVRHLTLSGAAEVKPGEQSVIADAVRGQKYDEATVSEIAVNVRLGLQDLGYYKATASVPQLTTVSDAPAERIVDASVTVDTGQRYRLEKILFFNNEVLGTGQLRAAFPLQDGDTFDAGKVRRGLQALRTLYVNQGYVNFAPVPEAVVDIPSADITLRIDTQEGSQFRLGTFAIDGPEPVPGAAGKLQSAWKHYEGKVFNDTAVRRFMRENAAYLPPDKMTWELTDMSQDSDRHVVNFRLMMPKPAEQTKSQGRE